MRAMTVLLLIAGLFTIHALAAEDGLVGWYSFEEGAGSVAADRSGSGNDGSIAGDAKWHKDDAGWALDLDGKSTYVDCGTAPSLDISRAGTISVWCRPRSLQGGIVNWSTGGGWVDERLVLATNTYHGGNRLLGCIAAGKSFQQFSGLDPLAADEWTHLALTLDGKSVRIYRDGVLCYATGQSLKPETSGVPMWIGRCQGLGEEIFDGLIDEVRVYNRALPPVEILIQYKEQAGVRGKDTSLFNKVGINAAAYRGPGKIVAALDARGMQPLPDEARIWVSLRAPGGGTAAIETTSVSIPQSGPAQAIIDVQELPPGEYEVAAQVLGAGNRKIGAQSRATVRWDGQPDAFKNVRILNNLVWELLNIDDADAGITGEHTFTNPTKRWVLIRSTAQVPEGGAVRLRLRDGDSTDTVTQHTEAGSTTLEAMRLLPAGEYTLGVRTRGGAKLGGLVVRSIPMLQHAFYGADPHIHPYGPYDWDFLKKDVLPNVNVMIGRAGPEIEEWKASGRQWISIIGLPKVSADDPDAVEKAYAHWSGADGFQHPLMDGVIVDEFGGGDQPIYDTYRQAIEKIYTQPQFAGRAFMPYGGIFYGKDRSSEFARTAVENGGYIAWEVYLPEQADEDAAREYINRRLVNEMPHWEDCFPDAASKMCLVLGYMSQPTESLNIDPGVDFKVYMDMQLQTLATHPYFFGLGGIQEYHSSYCDEENVRWAGLLYRHYAIEGQSHSLTEDPYVLPHLTNPDFAVGTEGWTAKAAEEGSVRTGRVEGFAWLEGRYPRTNLGDTFLLMRRNAQEPNTISQEIRDLEPGRLYSLKMITSDHQDLLTETSRKAENAVSISIDGVDMLSGPKLSFQFTFPNCYAHILGKFDAKYPYYMNYHWRVFVANSESALLTISDWASPQEPGGPIGQETMLNFVEVQPYIGQ